MAEQNNQNAVIASTTLSNVFVAGEEAKYFVLIEQEGFDMQENDFTIELLWGLLGRSMTLTKQDMTLDSSGQYFFEFDTTDMIGKVVARCRYYVPDVDDPDGVREKVDEQMLCFVASAPCPKFMICPASCAGGDHNVTYTRTDDSGIASKYQRLCTTLGQPIVTDDDLYLYVLTGAQSESDENDNENENND